VQALLLAFLIGCPGTTGWSEPDPSDDDDSAAPDDDDDATSDDDDDATASDDDDTAGDTASYPEEEAFFGLSVGNTWEYDEVLSGGPEPIEDVVFVEVVDRVSGPDFDPALPEALTVFEVNVGWLGGRREVHWYGINGTGAMRWYRSRIHSNPFESEEFEGDAETVLKMAADKTALFGESYDSVWFLPDVAGFDYRGEGATIETFFYGEGREIEGLGNDIYEGDTRVGLEVVKGGWGLLGIDVEVDGENIHWEITRCSICPADSGLN
jgi:hypothetical protein